MSDENGIKPGIFYFPVKCHWNVGTGGPNRFLIQSETANSHQRVPWTCVECRDMCIDFIKRDERSEDIERLMVRTVFLPARLLSIFTLSRIHQQMNCHAKILNIFIQILLLLPRVCAYAQPLPCSGICWAHDPSLIQRDDGVL